MPMTEYGWEVYDPLVLRRPRAMEELVRRGLLEPFDVHDIKRMKEEVDRIVEGAFREGPHFRQMLQAQAEVSTLRWLREGLRRPFIIINDPGLSRDRGNVVAFDRGVEYGENLTSE
ncbi:MAG: hypothetical protein ACP6KW_05450 [Candidatus Thorarchaeota archaeon]